MPSEGRAGRQTPPPRHHRLARDNEERISLCSGLVPAMSSDRTAHGDAVLRQRLRVARGAETRQQARRTLDVGEQERDGPDRLRVHGAIIASRPGLGLGSRRGRHAGVVRRRVDRGHRSRPAPRLPNGPPAARRPTRRPRPSRHGSVGAAPAAGSNGRPGRRRPLRRSPGRICHASRRAPQGLDLEPPHGGDAPKGRHGPRWTKDRYHDPHA